jgi:hypothetical protein
VLFANAVAMQYTAEYIEVAADWCANLTSSGEERVRAHGDQEASA